MADHTPVRWIVCYDITDARRGLAVHRCMKRHGLPLQYSVFLVEASPVRLRSLLLELEELISTALDDVRAYRWPERVDLVELGKTMLPGDVWIDIRRQAATQPAPPDGAPCRCRQTLPRCCRRCGHRSRRRCAHRSRRRCAHCSRRRCAHRHSPCRRQNGQHLTRPPLSSPHRACSPFARACPGPLGA